MSHCAADPRPAMVVVMSRRPSCALLCVVALLAGAGPARADRGSGDDGDRDARTVGRCTGGATSRLRLRSHDGAIRLEFEVKRRRARERWRVVIVHERRVAWRHAVRTGGSGSFRVRRSLDDLEGVDRVTVRASGPRGASCEAGGRLLG